MTLAHPRVADGRLEGEELLVAQFARSDVRWGLVEPALRQAVADHVLRGGEYAIRQVRALECLDVGAAEFGRKVGVLAVGLLDPPPARVAGDVEDRREGVARAGQQHPAADRGSCGRDDLGIEARGRTDRLLEARRGPGDEAVQALLVDDRRDPEPGLLLKETLDRVGRLRDLDRAQVGGAGQARDLADPVVGQRREPADVEAIRSDDLERPERAELGDLLGPCHSLQQVADACLHRQGWIAVGSELRGHPFTDPAVRPPTSCRSATR